MKKLAYVLLVFFVACKQKDTTDFEVTGTVKNSPAATIYLEETSFSNVQPLIVDSARLGTNGSFALHTKAKEETIYNLRTGESRYPFISLINDSKKIAVDADLNNAQETYTVKGSPASEALKSYLFTTGLKMRAIYNNNQLMDSLQKRKAADSLLATYEAQHNADTKELKDYTIDFMNKSSSPALTLFALGSYQSVADNPALSLDAFSRQEINDIINKTAAKFPANKAINSVKTSLQNQSAATASSNTVSLLSKPAPDFTLPDVNGKPVSLSSFKGKYVLVDFWASWCGPCRAENPNVVKAYQHFKSKNFTILGVSLDREKAPWLKAIQDDHLSWTHVSDLKFWDSQVVPVYNIEGIPYNVLVDPNGVIIGESLRGEELEKKLGGVLK